ELGVLDEAQDVDHEPEPGREQSEQPGGAGQLLLPGRGGTGFSGRGHDHSSSGPHGTARPERQRQTSPSVPRQAGKRPVPAPRAAAATSGTLVGSSATTVPLVATRRLSRAAASAGRRRATPRAGSTAGSAAERSPAAGTARPAPGR